MKKIVLEKILVFAVIISMLMLFIPKQVQATQDGYIQSFTYYVLDKNNKPIPNATLKMSYSGDEYHIGSSYGGNYNDEKTTGEDGKVIFEGKKIYEGNNVYFSITIPNDEKIYKANGDMGFYNSDSVLFWPIANDNMVSATSSSSGSDIIATFVLDTSIDNNASNTDNENNTTNDNTTNENSNTTSDNTTNENNSTTSGNNTTENSSTDDNNTNEQLKLDVSTNIEQINNVGDVFEIVSNNNSNKTSLNFADTIKYFKSKNITIDKAENMNGQNIELDSTDLIGTGSKLYSGDKTYTVIVYGDVTGDGLINAADINVITQSFLGDHDASSIENVAGDVQHDNSLDAGDISQMIKSFLGTLDGDILLNT